MCSYCTCMSSIMLKTLKNIFGSACLGTGIIGILLYLCALPRQVALLGTSALPTAYFGITTLLALCTYCALAFLGYSSLRGARVRALHVLIVLAFQGVGILTALISMTAVMLSGAPDAALNLAPLSFGPTIGLLFQIGVLFPLWAPIIALILERREATLEHTLRADALAEHTTNFPKAA